MACEEDGLTVMQLLVVLRDGCTSEYKLPLFREHCSKVVYHTAKYQTTIPCLDCIASCQELEAKKNGTCQGYSILGRLNLDNVSVTIESMYQMESNMVMDPHK